jgi:DNA-binding response OmpR family regulator
MVAASKIILVVDREVEIFEFSQMTLRQHGYEVLHAVDGEAGLEKARSLKPDLVILEFATPEFAGPQLILALKRDPATTHIPILIVTSKTDESEQILGLSMGADDHVVKPFSMEVLLARVTALLRRSGSCPQPQSVLKVGAMTIDSERHEVTVAGRRVNLTQTELKLLTAIAAARGRVMSRSQLVHLAKGKRTSGTSRVVDVHIAEVRRKLQGMAWMIHTVHGTGYRLLETGYAEDASACSGDAP